MPIPPGPREADSVVDAPRVLAHFRRQRRWTRDLVAAVPDEYFDWSPGEGSFSCGQLVRHLIQAEIFWRRLLAAAIEGESYDPFGIEGSTDERMRRFRAPNVEASANPKLGADFAECLASWERVQAETEALLAGLAPTQLVEVRVHHPLTGLEGTLGELLIVMFEHEAHHRGQLSAYMKVLGLEQPTSLWS